MRGIGLVLTGKIRLEGGIQVAVFVVSTNDGPRLHSDGKDDGGSHLWGDPLAEAISSQLLDVILQVLCNDNDCEAEGLDRVIPAYLNLMLPAWNNAWGVQMHGFPRCGM